VLISGLPAGKTNSTNFNGSFAVSTVLDANNFQYFQLIRTTLLRSSASRSGYATGSVHASSGVPFLTYTISPSTAGIAFNPITRTAYWLMKMYFAQHSFLDHRAKASPR